MAYYSYKTIDEDGVIVQGTIESPDLSSAYEGLSGKGVHVLSLKSSSRFFASIKTGLKSRSIKRIDVIEFANNLSVMLKAGVPLLTAMSDIIYMTENRHFQHRIAEIKHNVEMGMGLSGAIETQKDIFPDILIRLVKIGEETGRLDKSLSDVATHLQRMEDLASAIKRALIYPSFSLITTGGALIFWLAYVLPKIMSSIKEMGVKMPFITLLLLHVSEMAQSYWYLIPLFPVALFAVIQIMKQNEVTRYYIDLIKLKLPIVKLIVYNKLLALFSEQLRILIVAGITIDRSLNLISDIIGNTVFRRAIALSKDAIAAGSTISDALKESTVFPPLVIRMVNIGESSGTLDEQFAYLSEHYLKRLDDISEKMEKMIEPILVIMIGLIFAVIIVGLLMPIYDMVSKIGAG